MEPVEIRPVNNGFLVLHRTPENCMVNMSKAFVFETYEGLFEYLRNYWGPLIRPEGKGYINEETIT